MKWNEFHPIEYLDSTACFLWTWSWDHHFLHLTCRGPLITKLSKRNYKQFTLSIAFSKTFSVSLPLTCYLFNLLLLPWQQLVNWGLHEHLYRLLHLVSSKLPVTQSQQRHLCIALQRNARTQVSPVHTWPCNEGNRRGWGQLYEYKCINCHSQHNKWEGRANLYIFSENMQVMFLLSFTAFPTVQFAVLLGLDVGNGKLPEQIFLKDLENILENLALVTHDPVLVKCRNIAG